MTTNNNIKCSSVDDDDRFITSIDTQLRRKSYQMAILKSMEDRALSTNSRIDPIHTSRSLCTITRTGSNNDNIRRFVSQPIVTSTDNNVLLEDAAFLLDSPLPILLPEYKKSHGTLPSTNPFSTNMANECENECFNFSSLSIASAYRIVCLRSVASVLVLACLFTLEVLQTSFYSIEHSFQILLTLNLSSSIASFIFAAYISHVQLTRYRWKLSDVLAYDRCSQMLIILTTIFVSIWIIMQYFYSYHFFLLLSISVSGVCLSCMIIKIFDHFLQLSATLPIENNKLLTQRISIFICIFNSVCHLALTIGGLSLFSVIIYLQWSYRYILIGAQSSCHLVACLQLTDYHDNGKHFLKPLSHTAPINLTMYLIETKQLWNNEPMRYILVISFIALITISLIIQISTEWPTSIMSMSRRLSIVYYTNKDLQNDTSKTDHYNHYLIALFIGFQEGYVFGNIIKFEITCLYGLRHTTEMLIIFGLGATISSVLMSLLIKRTSIMTCISFSTLVHFLTISFLFFIRLQNSVFHYQGLPLKYILFLLYGVVIGLWSTITIYSLCNSTKFFSSSTFAQSLAIRYLGRIIAYICAVFLCQTIQFYIDTFCLLCLFSFIFIWYFCCHQ